MQASAWGGTVAGSWTGVIMPQLPLWPKSAVSVKESAVLIHAPCHVCVHTGARPSQDNGIKKPGVIVNPLVAEHICGLPWFWTQQEPLPPASVQSLKHQFSLAQTRGKNTTLDLFSGCGGLHLGVSARYEPVAFCDIDMNVQQVLRQRQREGLLPNCTVFTDVKMLSQASLKVASKVQAIVAGFPCVDVSSARSLARARALKQTCAQPHRDKGWGMADHVHTTRSQPGCTQEPLLHRGRLPTRIRRRTQRAVPRSATFSFRAAGGGAPLKRCRHHEPGPECFSVCFRAAWSLAVLCNTRRL
jgi:hypothetical protein